jgi:hypothetical protein
MNDLQQIATQGADLIPEETVKPLEMWTREEVAHWLHQKSIPNETIQHFLGKEPLTRK